MKVMSLSLLALSLVCVFPAPHAVSDTAAPEEADPENPNRVLDVAYLPEIEPFTIQERRIYYTRVNFWYEFDTHLTTNYARGQLVPINSRVELRPLFDTSRIRRKPRILELRVRLVDFETFISIKNIESYSGTSMYGIVYRMFSPKPLNLDVFDEEMQAPIKTAQLREGMTRYQALLARGYPPAHRTPTLESDR